MQIEAELGADIILPLDICAPHPCPPLEAREAMETTHRWAERALAAKERYNPQQTLFGIVQGAFEPDLRQESARIVGAMPFPGLSIGGLSVGEPKEVMWRILSYVTPELPRGKPRHLLGVGSPEDLVIGVGLGMDMFDCVLPTRVARHGGLFTYKGRVNIKSARFRSLHGPVEEGCDCYTCQNYHQPMFIISHAQKSNCTIALAVSIISILCYVWPLNSGQQLSPVPIQPFVTNSWHSTSQPPKRYARINAKNGKQPKHDPRRGRVYDAHAFTTIERSNPCKQAIAM